MLRVAAEKLELIRTKILGKFAYFVEAMIDPEFYDDEFHCELCDFMQNAGHKKLVVLPRTFLKTTIAAQLYALWRATKDTSIRVLITSNTTPNAQKTVHSIRGIVEGNKLYQLLFPEVIPNFGKTRWSDSCACLRRPVDFPEGTFEAAGVGSNIIRRHFNIIIEDDTVAPKKDELTGQEAMPTREDIEKAVGFHKLTIPLLINEFDERIVIGTRWASYDLINYVKKNESFAEFDKKCTKEDGKPRYKKFSLSRLKDIREGLSSAMFSSLYLNTPLAKEDMSFNPDWIVYYEEGEVPEEGVCIVTIDPADPPTGKAGQDYTAIVCCKHTKKGIYVKKYKRERVSDKKMIDLAFRMAVEEDAVKIRIETNRYPHLEAAFKEAMAQKGLHYIIETVKGKINKEVRIKNRLSPLFENGVIKLRKNMGALEEEMFTFPKGEHDDIIDALSWQIDRYIPREYKSDSQERKKVLMPARERVSFSLGEIRGSVRRAHRGAAPYPFQRQLEDAAMRGLS